MASRIVTFVLVATAFGRPIAASSDDPPKSKGEIESAIPVFLNAPADLDAFWKMLSRPDFVVLEGDLYRKLREASGPPGPSKTAQPAVVESVAVSGRVEGDWARLVVEYKLAMVGEGPSWVPIQLDGLTLSDVREGPTDLPTRTMEGRGWSIELKGQGEHVVRVALIAPVRSTADGRRLELAIPPASSTRIDLVVPESVVEASTGSNEEVALAPARDGPGVRLSARLGPRPRIDLAWHERADPSAKLPALLSAQGDISLDVERGSIRSRSSWVVESIRGTTSVLTLRLDPAEQLLDLEVDGKPARVEARGEGGRTVVTIPLAEPLRPAEPSRPAPKRTLNLTTRRPIASSGTARVTLQGHAFDQAQMQAGVIAIAKTGPIFVNPTPGRGLRRIDPRTELPERLRGRPDTILAFEFNDQPFELGLGVEPAPPRLRAESSTTVTIDPRSARLQTRLRCRTSQGRIFEVRVDLPKGLEFEEAGPADVVESAVLIESEPHAAPAPGAEASRRVTITLTPQARESDDFTIVLEGVCDIDPSRPVALPVFRPVVDLGEGERFAIVSGRNVAVELAPVADGPSPFRVDWGSPPTDWPWPGRKPGPDVGLIWLRSDATSEAMPLRVAVRPRTIRHESTLTASVDRQGADVVDEIAGEVAFGVVNRLDVALPPEVPDRWAVEGVELAGYDPLGKDPDGTRRYRLKFADNEADAFRLRIRYRVPFAETPEADRRARLRLAPIRVLEGSSTGRRVSISAEAGIGLEADAKGWSASTPPDPLPAAEGGPPARLVLSNAEERPGPVDLLVRAGPRMPLPSVVVSRLWLRTVQRPEDDLAASARLWVEARDGSMAVGLPAGSRWVRARVGGAELPEGSVDLMATDDYRLRFPAATPPGPVLVAIDFVIPAASISASGGWPTLELLDGGIIQQTLWEAQVPGSRAGVGTPRGWADENEWYWAGWLWKRRPRMSPLELSSWLTGGSARYRLNEPLESAESAGHQGYLFGRVGPPTTLRFSVFSRITLLLLCSGPVLAVGLLVLARRPPPRMVAASLLILGFAAGSLVDPDVLPLALQSSTLGIALWLTALAMQWWIERTGHARPIADGALILATAPTGSTMAPPPSPGSDDSTAIRPRSVNPSAASTADHFVLIRAPGLRPADDLPSDPDDR